MEKRRIGMYRRMEGIPTPRRDALLMLWQIPQPLINTHGELDGLVSCESFRDGFVPGARLMMEAACGQGVGSAREADTKRTKTAPVSGVRAPV